MTEPWGVDYSSEDGRNYYEREIGYESPADAIIIASNWATYYQEQTGNSLKVEIFEYEEGQEETNKPTN